MISTWTIAGPYGATTDELLVAFDRARARRVLVCPAWFDEANKLRRFTVEVMRRLDAAGIDSFLPDLPGCNDSLAPLGGQTLAGWQAGMQAAATTFAATHVLAIRAGALVAPAHLPGWHYAAQSGPKLLRGLIRARTIAAREAGREENADALMEWGRAEGLMLGGWTLGAAMIRELESAEPALAEGQSDIAQSQLGGNGLWLRAEPGDDSAQADALAGIVAGSAP
ncbi:hypothetical protein [Erythrobacter sp.]|uniref:hypothetical protein n=1 Tax=Erythrobacter sp. TaxID=1042 RepID=UPI0025D3F8B8|nr:hypothetical protein [Erythrobacter sp.]